MSLWTQLGLLLGKNLTLRKRQPVTIFVEFLWPLLILIIIALIKRASPPSTKGPCFYQPLELPNGDFLSFAKSFICMLDYRCFEQSQLKNTSSRYQTKITPLYDIIVNKDDSYEKIAGLLIDLKSALKDINELRNEPILLKIQNGSISFDDFLNDTSLIKTKLGNYGLDPQVADVYLSSKIKIIEIYKVLNFSSKIKQKSLCNPDEAMNYLIGNDFFNTNDDQDAANFQLASSICSRIPKRKFVGDLDFLAKQINIPFFSNYTSTIGDFFSSDQFNQTVYYLNRYLSAGQSFAQELSLFGEFSDLNEITKIVQNALKLLDLIQKYDQQILFAKKLVSDFAPIFSDVKEWGELENLVGFMISINDILKNLDKAFTVDTLFGSSVSGFFETELGSDSFMTMNQLLRTNVNFMRSVQFILKLKYGDPLEAVCVSPKITGIFNDAFPSDIKSDFDYKLEKYCGSDKSSAQGLGKTIFSHFNYTNIFLTIRKIIPTSLLSQFLNQSNALSAINFQKLSSTNLDSLTQAFNTINAMVSFLEPLSNDSSELDIQNLYKFAKKLVQIFAPDLISSQQWMYADILAPILLPTLTSRFESTVPRTVTEPSPLEASILNTTNISSLINDDFTSNKSNISLEIDPKTNETVKYQRLKRQLEPSKNNDKNENSVELNDVLKNLEFLENDPNAFIKPSFFSVPNERGVTKSTSNNNVNLLDLANMFGVNLSGLGITTTTTTKSPGLQFSLNDLLQFSGLSGNSASSSPLTLLSLINALSGSGSGGGSSISTLASLLPLLPIGQQLFHSSDAEASPQLTLGLISSIPQIVGLVDSFANHKLPTTNSTDPREVLAQWSAFVGDLRTKALNLVLILTNLGQIEPDDSKFIQSILSANIESIGNPEVIGKLVLACQAVNIVGVVQPEQPDIREAVKTTSQLIEIFQLVVNSTLQLVANDDLSAETFTCTSNPFADYYTLTKNVNVVELVSKLKELLVNQRIPMADNPSATNCLEIDNIYRNVLILKRAIAHDTQGLIKTKLSCLKNSIFLPYTSIVNNLKSLFNVASENANTITVIGSQMSKLADLVKIIPVLNKLLKTSNGTSSLLDNPGQLNMLFHALPSIIADINAMSPTFLRMKSIQASLQLGSLNGQTASKKVFRILESLIPFRSDIKDASQVLGNFWKSYFNILSISSYSDVLFDIQKGLEALGVLLNFVADNLTGVKIKDTFLDYSAIDIYLRSNFGFSSAETNAIGDSKLFYDPQKIFNMYMDAREIYCNPVKLQEYLIKNNSNFLELHYSNVPNFWQISSNFACSLNRLSISDIGLFLANSFYLPDNVRDIFENDSSIIMKLTRNSTMFTNLNISTGQLLSTNSINKLNGIFNLFSGISPDFSLYDIPNLFGRTLCGPEFSFRLEDYGYRIVPTKLPPEAMTNYNMTTPMANIPKAGRIDNSRASSTTKPQTEDNYCMNLLKQLQSIGGQVIGNLITPLLFGKILYTPHTNLTASIMKNFNQTFEQFDDLKRLLDTLVLGLGQFDDLKRLTVNMSSLLDNPFYQDFIQLFLLQDTKLTIGDIRTYLMVLETVTNLSKDWSFLSNILGAFRDTFACFEVNRFVAFETEEQLVKDAYKFFNNGTFLIAIVFENVKSTDVTIPPNFSIKLRTNTDNVPETNIVRPWLWVPGPADSLFMDLRYMRGFIQMQNLVERALIKVITDLNQQPLDYHTKDVPVVYLQQFPYPKYKYEDNTATYVNYFILPIVITLMWSGNIGLAIRNLVKDKEKFIEETMKAMGLRPGINWLAWFISTYSATVFVSIFASLILKFGSIFPLTNIILIFVSLITFTFSSIMLSFFVSSFFNKTNLASLIGILAYFVTYLPFILVMALKYEIAFVSKIALCFFTSTAFGYSSLYISWYEQQGKGLQFENIWTSPIANDSMSYGWSIVVMLLDGLVYGVLGWYAKQIVPGRYGAAQQPWYFLFTPKFWSSTLCCRMCLFSRQHASNELYKDRSFKDRRAHKSKDRFIEPEPVQLPVGISIRGLTKKFKEKAVVNNLTLNFFEGQITALLGHNGAGKSTTINVLTGIYSPTSGTAYINGRDVRYEYDQIRKNVGICPQHDILFEYMTVKEHLKFYGKLKGNMDRRELKKDINEMMCKMGLNQYANDYVSGLSGGLRRRLEVAIAFVSGSKTVILDEPTSGVDPYNRMKIWDIILEFRTGRTILLTTHYLEEADILSDRIAIIHQGKLQCCGSSLFLKNRFGSGYILTIDKKLISPSSASMSLTKQVLLEARNRSTDLIYQFISRRVAGATLTRQINNTLNFTLPYSQKPFFKDFFTALEKNKNILDIASYGISDTTLEEIFLLFTARDENGELTLNNKLAETVSSNQMINNIYTTFGNLESDKDSGVAIELNSLDTMDKFSLKQRSYQISQSPNITLNSSIDSISQTTLTNAFASKAKYTKLKGKKLYAQQFGALLLKRFHHYRRNLRILFTNILLPCAFVAISMALSTIKPLDITQNKLEMTPAIYDPNDIFYTFDSTQNKVLQAEANDYMSAINSICENKQSTYGNMFSSLKLGVTPHLCGLASNQQCSLIYQFLYRRKQFESSMDKTLGMAPVSGNCSIEPFLLDTNDEFINSRYGGISYANSIINNTLYPSQSRMLIWFENQAFHSMTSYLHEFYSSYLDCMLNSSPNSSSCSLISNRLPMSSRPMPTATAAPLYRIYNHPIPLNNIRISYDTIIQKVADIGISLTILCAYSFIPAGFVVYVVRERISQEKRLQYVCGVRPFVYWFAAFVWDFAYYLLIISLTIAVIAVFNSTAYTANGRNFAALVLLLVLFGWSSLPMTYAFSIFFGDSDTAYMIVFCFTLFSGIASCVAVFLLSFLATSNPHLVLTYNIIEKLSLLFPSFGLGSGLIELTKNQIMSDALSILGQNSVYKDPFSLGMLGQKYISLVVTGILFFIVIAIMESRVNFFPCCKPNIDPNGCKTEDVDVSMERKRIQNNEANYDILVAKNLTKRYRKATGSRVCAVNNVCFSIPWGHCFGLLGINGAGKTTTFKMITDELKPTFGNCLFNNMKLKEFLNDNIIGYCPQFDAVDEYLTGKEALYIYSKLIGINQIKQAMLSAISKFKLQSYIDIPIVKYSGGMKRTLSVAVSMLGDPAIVLLDEPTNAMDPEMRRRVWDNILNLIREDHSVLLTSHSMAECDALCSRLAIMVNGQFVCLGTTQHLKHRFGGGYTLQIKLLKDNVLNSVIDFVESHFLNCIMKDKHGNKLEYIIPHRGNSLGKIFGVMELNKDKYSIAEYSVSQTTLDQVFINFAKSSRDDEESMGEEDEFDEDEVDDEQMTSNDETEAANKVNGSSQNGGTNTTNTQMREKAVDVSNDDTAKETNSGGGNNNNNTSSGTTDTLNMNDTPTFESIKNHFNSLKKSSRHIRKTSSAKSQDFKKSQKSRMSQKSRTSSKRRRGPSGGGEQCGSGCDDSAPSSGGFPNLAYEIEFKNSDECELPIQESSQDLTTSINEDGEFFSKC